MSVEFLFIASFVIRALWRIKWLRLLMLHLAIPDNLRGLCLAPKDVDKGQQW
jgi:hypothetical protein